MRATVHEMHSKVLRSNTCPETFSFIKYFRERQQNMFGDRSVLLLYSMSKFVGTGKNAMKEKLSAVFTWYEQIKLKIEFSYLKSYVHFLKNLD